MILTQLSWSLDGTDAADFQITEDSTSGHGTLSFRNPTQLRETRPTARTPPTSHVANDNVYQVILKNQRRPEHSGVPDDRHGHQHQRDAGSSPTRFIQRALGTR